jgi:hypothetical protein
MAMTMLVSALALASALAAHDPDWSNVRHLKGGDEVTVTAAPPPQGLTTYQFASFVRADDDALFIRFRGAVRRIARDDVRLVMVRREKKRGSADETTRAALLGALLGVVGAAGGGTGPNYCTEHPHACVPVGVAVGGLAIGAAAYFGGHGQTIVEWVTIYSAAPVY